MADTVTKRLNVSDVITLPYEANKLWVVPSSSFIPNGIFTDLATYPTASNIKDYTQANLLYKSLLANYYPEFYPTRSLNTSSYYQTNNFNSTLTQNDYAVSGALRLGNGKTTYKFFPTQTSSFVYALNIPTSLYSNRILPTTVELEISGGKVYDDGEYNLRYSGSNQSSSIGSVVSQSSYVGNVFYEQGLMVFTVIPNSMISRSIAPTPVPVNETVVLWLSENLASTNLYDLYYFYNDEFNIPQSLNFSKTNNFFSQVGAVIRERQGTGYWATYSGTPLVQNKVVIPGPLVPQVFTFPAGSTYVFAFTSPGSTYVPYTNPPGPGGPGSFVNPTPVTGFAVLGNTNKRGITYP